MEDKSKNTVIKRIVKTDVSRMFRMEYLKSFNISTLPNASMDRHLFGEILTAEIFRRLSSCNRTQLSVQKDF